MKQITIKHRRSVEEIAGDIDEAMKDPGFRKVVRDFVRKTTS